MDVLPDDLSYLVSDLRPFTDYTFRVTAATMVGEGPAADITEKTREQGWTVTPERVLQKDGEGSRVLLFLWFCFDPIHVLFIFSSELRA